MNKDEEIMNNMEDSNEELASLTSEQTDYLQRRIKHYLSSYELETRTPAMEVAKKLGYTPNHYSRLKAIGVQNKVSQSCSFLANLANLKGMELDEFFIYLMNRPIKESINHRQLHEWEMNLLDAFSQFDSEVRSVFTRVSINDFIKNPNDKNRTTLELAISIAAILLKFDEDDFLLVAKIVNDIIEIKGINDSISRDEDKNKKLFSVMKNSFLKKLVKICTNR